jgi:putative sigma-54 modulation protein
MISKIDIVSNGVELNDDIKKYIEKKIARLDKYMTRHAKKTTHVEVKLKQEKSKKSDRFTAEVILHVPGEKMTARESTLNIYAAIDIVEAKLRNQLRKYKDKATDHKTDSKKVLRKLKRLADKDFWGSQN